MMKKLRGVVLAGGLGTRLSPLTKITNKHLLPVYDRPMIYYPIQALIEAGIRDVVLVTGGAHAGDFLRLLGDGRSIGLKSLHYIYQEGEGGIAHALGLVEHITKNDHLAVLLGDNIFQNSLTTFVRSYLKQENGAYLVLKEVPDPERFGVATVRGGRVHSIVEKPKKPRSSTVVTGLYFYEPGVFKIIRKLKPSKRGELEITDVNNAYIRQGALGYGIARGWWTDCGTFDTLFRANQLIEKKNKRKR